MVIIVDLDDFTGKNGLLHFAAFVHTGSCEEIIFSFSRNMFFPVGAMSHAHPLHVLSLSHSSKNFVKRPFSLVCV
jgi:hypothetical protein